MEHPSRSFDKQLVRFVRVKSFELSKNGERYIFRCFDTSEETRNQLFQSFGRSASDPELSFSWYDATVLSKETQEYFARLDGQK